MANLLEGKLEISWEADSSKFSSAGAPLRTPLCIPARDSRVGGLDDQSHLYASVKFSSATKNEFSHLM